MTGFQTGAVARSAVGPTDSAITPVAPTMVNTLRKSRVVAEGHCSQPVHLAACVGADAPRWSARRVRVAPRSPTPGRRGSDMGQYFVFIAKRLGHRTYEEIRAPAFKCCEHK